MEAETNGKRPYAGWHKAVIVGCLLIALVGTLAVVGGMVKMSQTIQEYGGTVGAAFYIALLIGLLSTWLFSGSGILLVYIAKTGRDIREMLAAAGS